MTPPIPLQDILNSKVNAEREVMGTKDFAKRYGPAPVQSPPIEKAPPTMKVHIEIERSDPKGHMIIKADIENQGDLSKFHEMYAGYLPRKKWLGVL
jgi:hypothetical protein